MNTDEIITELNRRQIEQQRETVKMTQWNHQFLDILDRELTDHFEKPISKSENQKK